MDFGITCHVSFGGDPVTPGLVPRNPLNGLGCLSDIHTYIYILYILYINIYIHIYKYIYIYVFLFT